MTRFHPPRARGLASSLTAFALLALLGSAGLVPVAAQEDEPPMPCDLSITRTVDPLTLYAGDETAAEIVIEPGCTSYENHGIDIMFVVDRTVRMREERYLEPMRQALSDFVIQMNFDTSSAGLMTFASSKVVSRNLTRNQEELLRAIDAIRPVDDSNVRGMLEAVRDATGKLDNDGTPGNEKIVLIAVAGQEGGDRLVNLPTVTQAARNAGVKFIFLMFPDARFSHFVDAASECYAGCPTWSGPRAGDPPQMKFAWGVERDGSNGVQAVMNMLGQRLLRPVRIDSLEVWEGFRGDVTFLEASAAPPPSRTSFPQDAFWTMSDLVDVPQTIGYRVTADQPGRYTITERSELNVEFSDGMRRTLYLDNPEIEVLDPATRPTAPPTETPTPGPTGTPEPTVEPTAEPTDEPTEEPTGAPQDDEIRIFLPAVLRNFDAQG